MNVVECVYVYVYMCFCIYFYTIDIWRMLLLYLCFVCSIQRIHVFRCSTVLTSEIVVELRLINAKN